MKLLRDSTSYWSAMTAKHVRTLKMPLSWQELCTFSPETHEFLLLYYKNLRRLTGFSRVSFISVTTSYKVSYSFDSRVGVGMKWVVVLLVVYCTKLLVSWTIPVPGNCVSFMYTWVLQPMISLSRLGCVGLCSAFVWYLFLNDFCQTLSCGRRCANW